MEIQWFPGHMAKTRKLISENIKMVDCVIEMLDARIPISSRNPEIDKLLGSKRRLIVLNKSDMANPKVSQEWDKYFRQIGLKCIFVDSKKGTGIKEFKNCIRTDLKDIIEKDAAKGRKNRTIRTMVVGIPNVGKSSFINKISGRSIALTGDRPGVTKSKQWIRLNEEIELLDTPGILWPKFEDIDVALNLAFTGAIKDDILDITEIASGLVTKLADICPDLLKERYKLECDLSQDGYELLKECGRKRGCLVSGGEIDLYRISAIILDEFRGCKIGRITLEFPKEVQPCQEN